MSTPIYYVFSVVLVQGTKYEKSTLYGASLKKSRIEELCKKASSKKGAVRAFAIESKISTHVGSITELNPIMIYDRDSTEEIGYDQED